MAFYGRKRQFLMLKDVLVFVYDSDKIDEFA